MAITDIIATAITIDPSTFEGRSARAIAPKLEKLLAKRVIDQRAVRLKVNLLEQLIAASEGRQAPVLVFG